jgi:chromosome segregation ATPase
VERKVTIDELQTTIYWLEVERDDLAARAEDAERAQQELQGQLETETYEREALERQLSDSQAEVARLQERVEELERGLGGFY